MRRRMGRRWRWRTGWGFWKSECRRGFQPRSPMRADTEGAEKAAGHRERGCKPRLLLRHVRLPEILPNRRPHLLLRLGRRQFLPFQVLDFIAQAGVFDVVVQLVAILA